MPTSEYLDPDGSGTRPPRLLIAATISRTLEAFLLPLARHFRARGWRVDGMAAGAPSSATCLDAFDHVWDTPWSRKPTAAGNITAIRRVREVVSNGSYDIVHVHTPIASFVTRFALRSVPRRPVVIYTTHGFHFYDGAKGMGPALYRQLERRASAWTDKLIVINHEDLMLARRFGIADGPRCEYIPGIGIDLDHYRADAVAPADLAAVRSQLGLAPTDRLLTAVAEFIPRKRPSDIVEALSRLPASNVHVAFVGDGPMLEPTRALATKLGVARRTHFLGFVGEVRPLIAAADALLLVSLHEGLPRSVMEAMAMGTPVIGTDVRGTRDLLAAGRGILVPTRDPYRLADAIGAVLDDPVAASAYAAAGREYVDTLSLPTVIALHEHIYTSVLGERCESFAPSNDN